MKGDEVIIFTQDFVFELTNEIVAFFESHGFTEVAPLMNLENNRKYSQIAGIFNFQGQRDIQIISPKETGQMHNGLQKTVGPVDLGGMKSGFQVCS